MPNKHAVHILLLTLVLVIVAALFFYFNRCTHEIKLTDDQLTVLSSTDNNLTAMKDKSVAGIYHFKCQPCHGKKAQLHALSKSAIINTWSKEQIQNALVAYKQNRRDTQGLGNLMHAQSMQLTHEEIKALAAYISNL